MRPVLFLLITTLYCSCTLYAQHPGIRMYSSLNNWQMTPFAGNQNIYNAAVTSGVHTYMNQYFDFGSGVQLAFPGRKHQWLMGLGYEVNSLHTVASNFYGVGELRRRFKVHFAMIQLGYLRKLRLGNYSFEAGGGLSALVNIHLKKSMEKAKLTFFAPGALGIEDFRYERFSLAPEDQVKKPRCIIPAAFLESRFALGTNRTGEFFLFANAALTINPALTYTWFFREQRFAFHQANRLSCSLGIHYVFNRK